MSKFENTYDERTGVSTTAEDRFQALLRSSVEYQRLDEGTCRDPDEAWSILLKLVSEINEADYQMYDHVGAGPFEDFVRRHGESCIERIEAEAATNPRFLRCLSYVWLAEGGLPGPVLDRLVEASRGEILVFSRADLLSEQQ